MSAQQQLEAARFRNEVGGVGMLTYLSSVRTANEHDAGI